MNAQPDFQKTINDIVRCHNERSEWVTKRHPEYVNRLTAIGNVQLDGEKRELVCNEHHPALMDVAIVRSYSAEFLQERRKVGGKRIMRYTRRYFVGETVDRIEIGSYYDRR